MSPMKCVHSVDNYLISHKVHQIALPVTSLQLRRKRGSHLCFHPHVLKSMLYFTYLKQFSSVVPLLGYLICPLRGQKYTSKYKDYLFSNYYYY